MIDESKVKEISTRQEVSPSTATFKWSALPVETLVRYKLEIESYLPSTKLKDVDVESELVSQLRIAQRLQAKVIDLDDEEIPLNQVVQAVNSVSGVIEKLARLQIELAGAENLKKMEAAFIKAVQTLPPEAVEEFFERYGKFADEAGVLK